jgi:hypothetical protein
VKLLYYFCALSNDSSFLGKGVTACDGCDSKKTSDFANDFATTTCRFSSMISQTMCHEIIKEKTKRDFC